MTMLSKGFFVKLNVVIGTTFSCSFSYQLVTSVLTIFPITVQTTSTSSNKLASSNTPWKLLSFAPGLTPKQTTNVFQENNDNSTNKSIHPYHHESDLITTDNIELSASSSVYERLLILQTKANLIKNSNITTSDYFKKIGGDIVSSVRIICS